MSSEHRLGVRAGCAFAILCGWASLAGADDFSAQVDTVFHAWVGSTTPGCAIGVEQNGKTLVRRAYGSADLEHGVANTIETVFEAGSSSKQFTAAAVLTLVQQGKVALKDDVRKYIPELPRYDQVITIDQLLNHTSGLRDWGAIEVIAGWPRTTRAYTLDDVLSIAARQQALNYAPGTEYSYTNTGYNLLAILVQRVTGQSLAAFTAEHLFAPLGMQHTQWRDDFRRVVRNRAIAYQKTETGYRQNMPFEDAYGNGGLLTTVGDLLKWNAALANGRLGPFVTSALQQPAVLQSGEKIKYARGLLVDTYRGSVEIAHPGATAGYRAWLGRYPEHGLSVALLCNVDDADSVSLVRGVVDRLLPVVAASQAAHPVTLTATQVSSFSGSFLDERTGSLLVLEAEQGHLRLKGGPTVEALSANEFRVDGIDIEFQGPDALETNSDEGRGKYKRISLSTPSTDDLSKLVGTYASEEAEAAYVVTVAEGGLAMKLRSRPQTVVHLAPLTRDVFTAEDTLVRFRRNSNGPAGELHISTDRLRDLRFSRGSTQ